MRIKDLGVQVEWKKRVDRIADLFLFTCSGLGLLLATVYDTWLIAIGTGGLCLIAYYAVKVLLPHRSLHHYVLSAAGGIYMALYIYQMHGMFEMHFFAFIGSAYLVVYQNWKVQIPMAVVLMLHHALFGYLQFIGMESVHFTQLDYMTLQVFVIHVLLATFIFVLCGLWAHLFHRLGQSHIQQSFEIGRLEEANIQKDDLLRLHADLRTSQKVNKDITDSIRYTQRLQQALLPEVQLLRDHFAGSFVFNRPHSIVGGDFLWFRQMGRELLVACVDCTGHGVPGAFMTIVATDLLNRVAREQPDQPPGIMLQMMAAEMTQCMGMERTDGVADGMDISLCRIDLVNGRLQFAGAMSPIILATSESIKVFKGTRHGLGGHVDPNQETFATHEIDFAEGDMLYLFSDGYTHQFGGSKDKKFSRSGLLALIKRIHNLPVEEQWTKVGKAFDDWKGAQHQTDDSLLVGLQLKSASAASPSVMSSAA